jgi:autotransporter family porin
LVAGIAIVLVVGLVVVALVATRTDAAGGRQNRAASATSAPRTDTASGPPESSAPAPSSAAGTPSAGGAAPKAAPARFATLPPGAALPSDTQCATWVRARAFAENKGANRTYNATTGHHVSAELFSGDDPRAGRLVAPRVDGQFTGTTGQILRWAACKWGLDEDIVLAQAAVESWWLQTTKGDFAGDANACPPGHGLGQDGKPGQCPQSYGILQDRYPYMKSGWPGFGNSTAMDADLAYGIWRACFEGYEGWLNTVEQGRHYAAGDAWGCVGRWFSGRWHTQPGEDYVAKVQSYLQQRIWQKPEFQQP